MSRRRRRSRGPADGFINQELARRGVTPADDTPWGPLQSPERISSLPPRTAPAPITDDGSVFGLPPTLRSSGLLPPPTAPAPMADDGSVFGPPPTLRSTAPAGIDGLPPAGQPALPSVANAMRRDAAQVSPAPAVTLSANGELTTAPTHLDLFGDAADAMRQNGMNAGPAMETLLANPIVASQTVAAPPVPGPRRAPIPDPWFDGSPSTAVTTAAPTATPGEIPLGRDFGVTGIDAPDAMGLDLGGAPAAGGGGGRQGRGKGGRARRPQVNPAAAGAANDAVNQAARGRGVVDALTDNAALWAAGPDLGLGGAAEGWLKKQAMRMAPGAGRAAASNAAGLVGNAIRLAPVVGALAPTALAAVSGSQSGAGGAAIEGGTAAVGSIIGGLIGAAGGPAGIALGASIGGSIAAPIGGALRGAAESVVDASKGGQAGFSGGIGSALDPFIDTASEKAMNQQMAAINSPAVLQLKQEQQRRSAKERADAMEALLMQSYARGIG